MSGKGKKINNLIHTWLFDPTQCAYICQKTHLPEKKANDFWKLGHVHSVSTAQRRIYLLSAAAGRRVAQQAKARPGHKKWFVWHQFWSTSDHLKLLLCGNISCPFKMCCGWKYISVLLKCPVAYGPVYAERKILCFGKDEDYWTTSVCHKLLSDLISLDLK